MFSFEELNFINQDTNLKRLSAFINVLSVGGMMKVVSTDKRILDQIWMVLVLYCTATIVHDLVRLYENNQKKEKLKSQITERDEKYKEIRRLDEEFERERLESKERYKQEKLQLEQEHEAKRRQREVEFQAKRRRKEEEYNTLDEEYLALRKQREKYETERNQLEQEHEVKRRQREVELRLEAQREAQETEEKIKKCKSIIMSRKAQLHSLIIQSQVDCKWELEEIEYFGNKPDLWSQKACVRRIKLRTQAENSIKELQSDLEKIGSIKDYWQNKILQSDFLDGKEIPIITPLPSLSF